MNYRDFSWHIACVSYSYEPKAYLSYPRWHTRKKMITKKLETVLSLAIITTGAFLSLNANAEALTTPVKVFTPKRVLIANKVNHYNYEYKKQPRLRFENSADPANYQTIVFDDLEEAKTFRRFVSSEKIPVSIFIPNDIINPKIPDVLVSSSYGERIPLSVLWEDLRREEEIRDRNYWGEGRFRQFRDWIESLGTYNKEQAIGSAKIITQSKEVKKAGRSPAYIAEPVFATSGK